MATKGNGMRVMDPGAFDINDPTQVPDTSTVSGPALERLGEMYREREVRARHADQQQRYQAGEFGHDPVTAYQMQQGPDPRELLPDTMGWGGFFGTQAIGRDAAAAQGKEFSSQGAFDAFSSSPAPYGSQTALQGLARRRG